MNDKTKGPLPSWIFLIVGAFLVAQFAGLGAWQVSRGLEKRATQHAYEDEAGFSAWQDGMEIHPHQRLNVTGRYAADHQFILGKIIVNDRYGYYVITPLFIDDDTPALLVNRGWIQKTGTDIEDLELDAPGEVLTVRGYVGSLPLPGYDKGKLIHPSLEEMAATLGRPVQPFVLLMDRQEQHGYLRHWAANDFGPGKHFGYALQWFAMGAALFAILIWNYRKKRPLAP